MAAAVTTKTAKDGASTPGSFPLGFLDVSGTGAGPFAPLHALYDSTGALINPATSANIASLSTAITGALAPTGGLLVALQGTAAVTQSGTWTVSLAAGATVNLGTLNGAATATLQTTINTTLTGIAGQFPASLGAKASAGSLSVAPATDALFKVAMPDVPTTGTIASGTANASFGVALANGAGVIGFALSGLTASGATLIAEAANDGGTIWAPINLVSPATGALATTTTIDGNYRVNAGGYTNVRLRVSGVGTGTINVAALASSQNPIIGLSGPVTLAANGLGALTAVPAASTNGTPLSASPPTGKRGARLYVPPGASISFTIAAAQPSSAPTTITVANPSANTVPANWDEDLAGTQMIYVTAVTGSPLFRWY